MSVTQCAVIPPAPSTVRGQPLSVGVYKKGNAVVYGNGPNVYIRNIEEPEKVDVVHRNRNPVTTVRVSPSQCYAATGDKNGNLLIWALDNVQHTVKLDTQALGGAVNDIAWTGDNERVVVVGEGKESFACALLVNGGNTVGTFAGHTRNIISCDCRPERPFVSVTGSEDTQVNIYEGPPYKFKVSRKDHSGNVNCVRFSPDGSKLISVSSDKTVLLYDGKTGEKIDALPCDHGGSVYSVSWHSSGERYVTSSADKTVKLWDLGGKRCLQTFTLQDKTVEYMQVAAMYVGESICSIGLNGDVNVFRQGVEKAEKVLRGHQKSINTISIADGVIVSGSSDPSLLVWGLSMNPAESVRAAGKKFHGSQVSASFVSGGKMISCGMDDTIGITNVGTGEFVLAEAKVSGGPSGIAPIGDGQFAISTGKGVWVVDGSLREAKNTPTKFTPTCCVSHKNVLAVGSKEKEIILFDTSKGMSEIQRLSGHKSPITSLAWTVDGSTLASADAGKEILLWAANEGFKQATDSGSMVFHTAKVNALAFNSTGTLLASGGVDGMLIIWDLKGKGRVKVEGAHLGGVNCVAFKSDTDVVTGGQDGALRAWTARF